MDQFLPHMVCLRATVPLVGLHAVSDLLISLAYKIIPATLGIVAWRRHHQKREDMRLFWLFFAFIVLCGFTHDMDVVVLWYPVYWSQGLIKFVTAVVSFAVAVVMVMSVPALISLPSHAEQIERTKRLQAVMEDLQEQLMFYRGDQSTHSEIDALRNSVRELRTLVRE